MDIMKFQLIQRGDNQEKFKSYPIKATHRKPISPSGISPSRLQYIRPRSSPKRDLPATEPLAYRSLTPSPKKRLEEDTPRSHPDVARAVAPTNTEQRLYSFEGTGSGQTYFSSRPPVDPMRIVLVGDPPEYCSTYARVFENQCKIERTLSLHQSSESEAKNTRVLTAFSSPTRREARSGSRRKQSSSKCNKAAEFQRSCDAVVLRTWIHQLISSLPLSATVALSDANSDCLLEEPDSVRSEQVALTRNVTPTRSPDTSRCSIAVQALPNKCSSYESNFRGKEPEGNPAALPEEWVGGVRALRDSHVRLVLRQLKHIDRLNRALDHAVTRTGPLSKRGNKKS